MDEKCFLNIAWASIQEDKQMVSSDLGHVTQFETSGHMVMTLKTLFLLFCATDLDTNLLVGHFTMFTAVLMDHPAVDQACFTPTLPPSTVLVQSQ